MRDSSIVAVLLGALALGACEGESEACVKARNDASNTWKQVQQKAAKFKHSGAVGFEELSEAQKGEHVKTWTAMETQAEMLHKSFAFSKITWNTADPAKKKINELFDGFPQKSDYKSFGSALASANTKHDAVRSACK